MALAAALSVGACGHVSFYDDQTARNKETGIKFYTPKPYVLVSRVQAKDSPIKVEVVYLPDLQNPIYARTIPGWGSSNLSLEFSNGF